MKSNAEKLDKINEIDFFAVLKKKLIWILVVGIIVGSIVFAYGSATEVPMYTATVMLYVNNASISVGGASISVSQGDINASRSLVNTLVVILNNSTVIDEVIEKAGIPYSYNQLRGMITASAVDNTEIMRVSVTTEDPDKSALIAETIAEVFPIKISEIIDGSSARLLSHARVSNNSTSKDTTSDAIMGSAIAMAAMYILFLIIDIENQTITSSEDITQTYDIPLLGEVPNLLDLNKASYYRYKHKYGYRYGYGNKKKEDEPKASDEDNNDGGQTNE